MAQNRIIKPGDEDTVVINGAELVGVMERMAAEGMPFGMEVYYPGAEFKVEHLGVTHFVPANRLGMFRDAMADDPMFRPRITRLRAIGRG